MFFSKQRKIDKLKIKIAGIESEIEFRKDLIRRAENIKMYFVDDTVDLVNKLAKMKKELGILESR